MAERSIDTEQRTALDHKRHGLAAPPRGSRLRLQKRTRAMAAMTTGSAMVGAPPYGPEKLNTFVSTRTAIEAVTLWPALSLARIRMMWSPSARMSCFALAVPREPKGPPSTLISYPRMPEVPSDPAHVTVTPLWVTRAGSGSTVKSGGVRSIGIRTHVDPPKLPTRSRA